MQFAAMAGDSAAGSRLGITLYVSLRMGTAACAVDAAGTLCAALVSARETESDAAVNEISLMACGLSRGAGDGSCSAADMTERAGGAQQVESGGSWSYDLIRK